MLVSEFTGIPVEQTLVSDDADQETVDEMASAVAVAAVEEEE